MEQSTPIEYRCTFCNKLLFKGKIFHAMIEIKCRGCKNINLIEGPKCGLLSFADTGRECKNAKDKADGVAKLIAYNCNKCDQITDCRYLKIMKIVSN